MQRTPYEISIEKRQPGKRKLDGWTCIVRQTQYFEDAEELLAYVEDGLAKLRERNDGMEFRAEVREFQVVNQFLID